MKRSRIIAGIFLMVIVSTGLSLLLGQIFNRPAKIQYIDLEKVYKEFKLKSDMEKEAEGILKGRELLLDSLYQDLQLREKLLKSGSSPKEKASFERDKAEYLRRQEYFSNSGEQIIHEYNQKLWVSIQQEAEKYCAAEGIDILLGKGSAQVFVYGQARQDCTQEFIEYINKEYGSKKK